MRRDSFWAVLKVGVGSERRYKRSHGNVGVLILNLTKMLGLVTECWASFVLHAKLLFRSVLLKACSNALAEYL